MLLTRKRQIAAKEEAVEGTEETLAAVDGGLLVIDPKWEPDVRLYPRAVVSDTFSKYRQIPGQRLGRITFQSEVKGSGAAGTPPALGKYLEFCGWAETIVPSTSVTYKPTTNGIPSCTIALYTGDNAGSGLKVALKGSRGTVRFSMKVGEPMIAEMAFTGVIVSPITAAPLSSVNYDNATEPPIFQNAAFSIASYAALISQLTIDMANQLALRDDPSKPEGYASCMITDRRPVGSFDPETTVIATHDWFGRLRDGTEGALAFTLGGTAGNIVTVNAPKVQYAKLSDAERNGISTLGVDLLLNKDIDAGNDEISLVFT